ncbi:MAG: hypothetical protein ACK5Z2_10065 [Bacteroidota bacterium]|jgi:hypothetical protein
MKRILLTLATPVLLFAGCSVSADKQSTQSAAAPELQPLVAAATIPVSEIVQVPVVEPSKPVKRKPKRRKPALAFTPEAIQQQQWLLSPQRDTLVKGSNGTTLHIPADAFCFANGQPVKTPVTLQLREAVKPADIVLAGLTTLHNGRVLESGGMIEVIAQSEGRQLRLKKSAAIEVNVPANVRQPGMAVFEGVKENGLINWVNPVAIDSIAPPQNEIVEIIELPGANFSSVLAMIQNDTVFFMMNDEILINEQDKFLWEMITPAFPFQGNPNDLESRVAKGVNNFDVNPTQSYAFSIKKLGWANIDRLSNDPRTQQVDFVTQLANNKDYNTVNISLVFPGKNIYLPGYQKADGTYGFSHGDYEPMRLPVGENAILLVTAKKDDQIYFTSHQLVLEPSQTVELTAEPCTQEEMKDKLDKLL